MSKKIAITGGIGSGKSTAIQQVQSMGYPVFSCDEIYREVINTPSYIDKIKEYFPSTVINGKIDRKLLAQLIFQDPQKRHLLNSLAHPLIMEKLNVYMKNCASNLVFAEVPLLFEGNFEEYFDYIFVIEREVDKRIQALQKRDHFSIAAIQERIDAQFDYSSLKGQERLKKCNAYIILNNDSVELLNKNLSDAVEEILKS